MLRPKLNRVWASTSSVTRRDPGDAKYIQGWISEIPTYQVLNYLQYKIDTTLLALAERGFFEWGTDVQYGSGSVVWDELTKKIYVSLVGAPDKTKAPSTNLTQWAESSIQIPRANYDAAVAAINAHIADITGNPHKLTAGRLNAYNKAEIDAIVVTYRNLVAAHANDKNNPHGVTALQVGAVPITGGTYIGDVTFNGGLFFDSGKVNKVSTTGGLFLQTGNFVLGINTAGDAVTGPVASPSKIVTEQTFPALKAAREPLYAVPEPAFQMGLINSICNQRGVGLTTADFVPQYSPTLGAIIMSSDMSRTLMNMAGVIPAAVQTWTLACDIASNTPVNSDGNSIHIQVAIEGNGSIQIRGNGDVVCNLSSGGAPRANAGQMSNWTRLVMVVDGPNVSLFINGVLVSSVTDAVHSTSGSGRPYLRSFPLSPNNRQFWLRGWRLWSGVALTAAQVSTL